MAKRLLRNIAVSIGAGLAAGIVISRALRPVRRTAPDIHPILTRLEEIEYRISRVEFSPPPPAAMPAPEEIEALGTLVSSQNEDLASLRHDILRIERRNAQQVDVFGRKVASLEEMVAAQIETSVAARMAEMEQRLRSEFQEIHNRTVVAFTDTIEKRVVDRIASLETNLIAQSKSIGLLREKSAKTDEHLQRLLQAVEKLCARMDAPAPPEPFAEPVLMGADPASRSGMKSFGMAILGLAIIGFRFIR